MSKYTRNSVDRNSGLTLPRSARQYNVKLPPASIMPTMQIHSSVADSKWPNDP